MLARAPSSLCRFKQTAGLMAGLVEALLDHGFPFNRGRLDVVVEALARAGISDVSVRSPVCSRVVVCTRVLTPGDAGYGA
jgi:hypothetical protein